MKVYSLADSIENRFLIAEGLNKVHREAFKTAIADGHGRITLQSTFPGFSWKAQKQG